MTIGEVIRTYRKQKNMTQEEMAGRLGVTAPAVNKWEMGNSLPDIMLLAPIARLLEISLDELLSFRENLTADEIREIVCEVDAKLKETSYEEAFLWAKKKMEEYPGCEELGLQIATIFFAQSMLQEIPEAESHADYLLSLCIRALESRTETVRVRAADSLVGFYMRREQYEKAEEYLDYFSAQNPMRKWRQAKIYAKTNRVREAWRAYEEVLFSSYQLLSGTFHEMYGLAMREDDRARARMFAGKEEELARCFDMGKYYEASAGLEFAVLEKDADEVLKRAEEMLAHITQIGGFRASPLFAHMEFKEVREEFLEELQKNLRDNFREDESFEFLKENSKWQALINS